MLNIASAQEHVKIEADFDQFCAHCDSGSIYFALNENGWIPLAIHRCSSYDGKYSYSCVLNVALERVAGKHHINPKNIN